MPRLKTGDQAPSMVLPSIDGTTFDMSLMKGKRVIFTFFRFSSCPFCNIRIDRLMKRWEEFPEGTVMVGVFDAKIEELTKRMGKRDIPFTIVADETYEHFENNGLKRIQENASSSVKRVVSLPSISGLSSILPYLETKTVWHPKGT